MGIFPATRSKLRSVALVAYRSHLPDLEGWSGWYALVIGENLVGLFPTWEAAARASNAAVDRQAVALICQIEGDEVRAAKAAMVQSSSAEPVPPDHLKQRFRRRARKS